MSDKEGREKNSIQPSDLNGYIRVTTTGVWLILAAVLIFVCGLVVWGINARLTTSVQGVAVVRNREMKVYLLGTDAKSVKAGDEISVNGSTLAIAGISEETFPAGELLDAYQRSLAGFRETDAVACAAMGADIPDGDYNASVTIETLNPIRFVFGGK